MYDLVSCSILPEYDALQRGVTFTVREGAKVVGYGTVTSSIIES
jgi:hypothetical protein